MLKLLWKLRDNQPVGVLKAQYYDRGNDDKHYVSASYRSTSDPDFELALLLPLLYESQLMVLVDPYAKNLADGIVSSLAHYKNGASLSTILPLNTPTANAPMVLSSKAILHKNKPRDEYFIEFLPEFKVPGDKDAIVARFLWALLPWAFTQFKDADFLLFVLAHLDLVSNVLSKRPRTQSGSPLARSDARNIMSGFGWAIPNFPGEDAVTASTLKFERPAISTNKQLEFWLQQFGSHVGRAMELIRVVSGDRPPDPFDPDHEIIEEKQRIDWSIAFHHASHQLEKARESLKKADEIWPEGRKTLKELRLGTDELFKLIENYREIDSLLSHYEPFYTTTRMRPLILKNRKHAADADSHFRNGLSRLEELAGIEISIGA